MNLITKKIVLLATGLGLGAIGGYYYAKDKYEALLEEERALREEREAIESENCTDVEVPKIGDESEDGTGEEAATRMGNDPQGMPFKAPYKPVEQWIRRKDTYTRVIKNYGGISDDSERMDPADTERPHEDSADTYDRYEQMSEEANNVYDRSLPYIISVEEYNEGCKQYDKLTISYYEEDDTLADEGEEIIENPEEIVGEDTLERFGEDSDDPDIVYVRNEKLQIDYEIILMHKSYSETVLGMSLTDVNVKRQKIRKKRGLSEE